MRRDDLRTTPTIEAPLVVRYSSWRTLWVNVGAFFVLALLAWYDLLGLLWPVTVVIGIVALYTLADAALALDRTPMLIIDASGTSLPAFGGETIRYEALDSFWFTRRHRMSPPDSWWTLSLQCRPRRAINGTWRTVLHTARTNTLVDGDVMFDCRFLTQSETVIAKAIKRYHPGGWLRGAMPGSDLSELLPNA